jgi:spermidine synthase
MARRRSLYCLFFLSGVSALVYELVWQRLLNLVFGVSTLSVSAVLAAFMGGLALGGFLFGRLADRAKRPLVMYACLEAGIGILALLVLPAFSLLTHLYSHLYIAWEPGLWSGTGLRFALALLILLPPATMLGATLPVMGRLACPKGNGFSLLYAINTLGGLIGAALTGFVLLRLFGMRQTLFFAVGINALVALSALTFQWLVRPANEEREHGTQQEQNESGTGSMAFPLFCAALSGATGLGLEVAWARILGILTSNSAFGFALLLSVLLLGLGLGSLLVAAWSRRRGDPWRRLAFCQWALAGVTLVSLPFFHTTPTWLVRWSMGASTGQVFMGELLLTACALLGPAVLLGMSLPLIVGGLASSQGFNARLGRLYAANTLGCVAGAFLVGFVFVPRLGLHATLGLLVACPALVGLASWLRAAPITLSFIRGIVPVAVATALCLGWRAMPAGKYLKSPIVEGRKLLYYSEGDNGTVAVIEEGNRTRSIMVDGQPVAGTGGTSVVDQKMLAHLPLLLHPSPRRALTVGFGSGGTSHSMALHGVQVDCVEIEGRVPGAADLFQTENQGILAHSQFRLVLDDARSWLRVAPMRYDAIVTDCTNIQYRSNGDLYTVDYFQLMRDRLAKGGLAAAWVPANGIAESDLKTLIRSFRAVFPHTSVWFMNTLPTDFLILVGTPGPLSIDLENLRTRAAQSGVADDLAMVGMADSLRLACTLLTAEDALAQYLGEGPLNTDDRPVLSYSTYGASFRDTIAGNLLGLMKARVNLTSHVRQPFSEIDLLRTQAASGEAVLGHISRQLGNPQTALFHYIEGAKLLPGDPALADLVRHSYFSFPAPH